MLVEHISPVLCQVQVNFIFREIIFIVFYPAISNKLKVKSVILTRKIKHYAK